MELWRLLAHNHWFTLDFKLVKIRLCARCSGYLIGFLIPSLLMMRGVEDLTIFNNLNWQHFSILLAIPLIADWITQSWGLRQSNNLLRIFTGSLLGFDLFIFKNLEIQFTVKVLIFFSVALVVMIAGYIGKHRT